MGAEAVQGRCRHVGLHRHRHAEGSVDTAQLLAEDHRVGVVGPLAPVRGVVLEPECAGAGEGAEDVVERHGLGGLPLVEVGLELALQQASQRLPEELVLGRELHGDLRRPS